MIITHDNASLKRYNTFGIDCRCRQMIEYNDNSDLTELFNSGVFSNRWMVLGYGANTLFAADYYDGSILRHTYRKYRVVRTVGHDIYVYANAGWVWDDFIAYTMQWGIAGAENLSGIPASVGGAIVQNIGAYGMEISELVHTVEVFDIRTGKILTMDKDMCGFGYRTSVFKRDECPLIVTGAVLRLRLEDGGWEPCLKYTPLREYFRIDMKALDIREWVLRTRNAKLPDPQILGNAGSFFMNPVVSDEKARTLSMAFPEMPQYKTDGGIKLAAGWMIDNAGLKGYRQGPAGVDSRNALVLVNHGGAIGTDILALADTVISKVKSIYDVELHPEIRIIR